MEENSVIEVQEETMDRIFTRPQHERDKATHRRKIKDARRKANKRAKAQRKVNRQLDKSR